MNIDFAEKFNKKIIIKGLFLITPFLFSVFSPSSFLGNNAIIKNNISFIVYGMLFILSILLFNKTLKDSVVNINKDYFKFAFVTWVIVVILMVISSIVLSKFGLINYNDQALDEESSQGSFILFSIAAIIFGPVVEELIYRFLLFRWLRNYNLILAHLLVALLFSFMHVGGFAIINKNLLSLCTILPYIFLSLGLSIVYEKSKTLAYPIIFHMFINIIATS